MTARDFDDMLRTRLNKTLAVLKSKAAEYATDDDRLHNFKRAAKDFPSMEGIGTTPADTLVGMMRKHWVSIADIVDRHGCGESVSPALIDEKIGDAVNYLILLEAVLLERGVTT